ncbi:MAG: PAS domain S-box protein [Rhodospirillaceae bacterium]|nr:PAS domain S-box protein [Rhodospirillaceae bacterium]
MPAVAANSSLRDRPARPGPSNKPALLAAIAACLLVLLGFSATAWLSYHDEIEDAARDTRNMALVLKEHAARTTHGVDIVLQWTVSALLALEAAGAEPRSDQELSAFLRRQMEPSSEILNLSLIGPDGTIRGDALNTPTRPSFADRSYFKIHLREGTGLFISELIESRANRGRVVVMSRRVTGPEGRFIGVVAASVSVDYFLHFYANLDVNRGDIITLRDRDGIIIARYSPNPNLIGMRGATAQITEAVRAGSILGTLTFLRNPEVPDRIVSYHAVAGTPFIVSVATARSSLVEVWARTTIRYGLVALALMIAIGGLIWGLTRANAASRRSDDAALKANRRLADAIEALPVGFALFDEHRRVVTTNSLNARLFPEVAPFYVPGALFDDLLKRVIDLGSIEKTRAAGWFAERMAAYEKEAIDIEYETSDGRWFFSIARRTSDGGRVFVLLDITERKRGQIALAQSEAKEREAREQLETILNRMPIGCLVADADLRMTYMNPAAERIFGCRFEDMRGLTPFETGLINTDRDIVETMHARLKRGEFVPPSVAANSTKDGRKITCEWINTPLMGADGSFQGVLSMCQDITERRQNEIALQQAQKMEAIGQLTGGMAHDFNNLLTVILGNAAMLADGIEKPDDKALAQMIEEAALRGSALTHRLLAFARKQPLQPVGIDANALVSGMEGLLRRTLGEDIDFVVSLGENLPAVLADAAQLESALLNLVINSRDAMPDGGTLTVETALVVLDPDYARREADVRPGTYVMLAVTDTGSGMSPEVQRRIFEPFFTTKEVGKGTGLGLSMVFGFVKQSGGHIKIYSEVGLGTTVKLYLPPADPQAAVAVEAEAAPDSPPGQETILVVEDDEAVRSFAISALIRLGYRVHEARHGAEALDLLDTIGDFDLLFTDVVLPKGMNGRELAEEVKRRRPGVRVLYTSGYTADAIVHQGRLDPGIQLLSKPYRKPDLARRVREALAAPPT